MSDRNKTIALIGALALVLLIATGVLWAGLSGRPVDSFLPTLLAFAIPTITALLTTAGVRNDLDKVHKQVNGNLERVQSERDALVARVAQLEQAMIRPAASGPRHAVDTDTGPLHLSHDVVAGLSPVENTAKAEATTRTVSGLVLPWGKTGSTTAGPLSIAHGAVRLPRDIARCKLHFKHTGTDGHRPVGYATGYEVRDDGLHMTFKIARTPDGDAALLQVTEGVYNAFSAELAAIVRDGASINVTDSVMTGVALVDTPAFSDARVLEVQAAHTQTARETTTMDVKELIRSLIALGLSEESARRAAADRFGQAAVDGVTSAELAEEPAAPAADVTTPAVHTPEPTPTAPIAANAGYAPAILAPRPAVVPSGIQVGGPAVAHASAHEAAATLAHMVRGNTDGIAHAALTDITNSGLVDALPPAWLGELWSGPAKTRRLIPLMNGRDLRSWRIQGFKWTQKPLVASYAGDKAEIPTGPVSVAPYEAEAVRWAGGHDLDRKFFDFGDAGILESYWRAMNESYATVTDAAAGAWVVANATTVAPLADVGTVPPLVAAMFAADAAIEDATGVHPSYWLANPADRWGLMSMTAEQRPVYFDMLGVDPHAIVWTSAAPAGTLVAGARPAATFHELPGSPLRVEAEHLSHGGRDRAMFGYTALTLDNAAGLVKVQFTAPAGG